MNRIIPIILLCCLTISGLMAQDENFPKPQVFTNTYFDISPPIAGTGKDGSAESRQFLEGWSG
jgi:hypothetical protein